MREEYISKLLKLIDQKKTKKIYPSQSPSDFNSSINIVRTLAERKPVFEQDFFENKSNIIILPMAEKIDKSLACFLKGKMENSKDKLGMFGLFCCLQLLGKWCEFKIEIPS